MANWHKRMAGCIIALAGILTGCQAPQTTSMVEPLPPPNFGGPVLASPALVPPSSAQPDRSMARAEPAPRHALVSPQFAFVPAGIPRDWIPVAAPNGWKWIVIHHSATSVGGAVRFGREHKAKGWDELGYHFVIGNGTDTRDGQIEVGSRWPKQKWGAHAKTSSEVFNNYGIGICLVGNFDTANPSAAQLASLARLVAYLERTYHIPSDHVIGHRDTKSTDCPGRHVSLAVIRRMSNQILAESGASPELTRTAAALPVRELLVEKHMR